MVVVVVSPGVSNFGLGELRELLAMARVRPSVLQARSDPFAANSHLVAAALAANISFMGYSSLGTQWINSPAAVNPVFNNRVLRVSLAGQSRVVAAWWPACQSCAGACLCSHHSPCCVTMLLLLLPDCRCAGYCRAAQRQVCRTGGATLGAAAWAGRYPTQRISCAYSGQRLPV